MILWCKNVWPGRISSNIGHPETQKQKHSRNFAFQSPASKENRHLVMPRGQSNRSSACSVWHDNWWWPNARIRHRTCHGLGRKWSGNETTQFIKRYWCSTAYLPNVCWRFAYNTQSRIKKDRKILNGEYEAVDLETNCSDLEHLDLEADSIM